MPPVLRLTPVEVSAGVDSGAVASELGVIVGDAGLCGFGVCMCCGVFEPFGLPGELADGHADAVGVERFAEPVFDLAEQVGVMVCGSQPPVSGWPLGPVTWLRVVVASCPIGAGRGT